MINNEVEVFRGYSLNKRVSTFDIANDNLLLKRGDDYFT
jgi:hypothetical protein